MTSRVLSAVAPDGQYLTVGQIADLVARACQAEDYRGRKVLLIVPDATRTAPVDWFFRALHAQIGAAAGAFDVMVALGTHPPMGEAAICARLGISLDERRDAYRNVQLLNHEWQNPAALASLGTIPAAEIEQLSGGLFSMDVEVRVNRRLFDYDRIIIVGPVFPHEVVGFLGRQQIPFPRRQRPGGAQFFPLARRGRDQPHDHRPQAHRRAPRRGPRRRDGERWTSSVFASW